MPSILVNGASRDVTAMTFLQAAGVAMIPSVVWGWFFVSRNPESRQLVVVTFLLGTLAVVPLLLFMAGLGVQLQSHEAAAMQLGGQDLMQQLLSMLAFLVGIALVLIGVIKLFHLISRRVTRHSLRFGALLLAALLLLAATLSYDQLSEILGAWVGHSRTCSISWWCFRCSCFCWSGSPPEPSPTPRSRRSPPCSSLWWSIPAPTFRRPAMGSS